MLPSQKPSAPVTSPNATPDHSAVRITPPVKAVHPTSSAKQISATTLRPSDSEIRDYAHHLFEQRGSVIGHDGDDWREAEACLVANIPKESSRTRMHHHTQIAERLAIPLVKHGRS